MRTVIQRVQHASVAIDGAGETAIVTRPAPVLSAAFAQRQAAPIIPVEPARIITFLKSPLCVFFALLSRITLKGFSVKIMSFKINTFFVIKSKYRTLYKKLFSNEFLSANLLILQI